MSKSQFASLYADLISVCLAAETNLEVARMSQHRPTSLHLTAHILNGWLLPERVKQTTQLNIMDSYNQILTDTSISNNQYQYLRLLNHNPNRL